MGLTKEEVTVQLGMDSRPLREEAGKVDGFMEKFSHKLGNKIDKVLMGIMGLNLISVIKHGIEQVVDFASRKFAEAIFGMGGDAALAAALDEERALFKKLNADKRSAEEKLAAILKKEAEERLSDLDKIDQKQMEIMDTQKEISRLEKEGNAREDAVKLAELRLRKKQEELDLEKMMIVAHEKDVAIEKERIAIQDHLNKIKAMPVNRETIALGIKKGEDFRKPLDEINQKLLNDEALLKLFPNDMNRTNLKMDLEKRRRIVGDIQSQINQSNPQRTAAQEMTDAILGRLETSKDGIPVSIRSGIDK